MNSLTSEFLDNKIDDGQSALIMSQNGVPAGEETLWAEHILINRRELAKQLYGWLSEREDLFNVLADRKNLSEEAFVYLCRMMKNSFEFFNIVCSEGAAESLFEIFSMSSNEDILETLAAENIVSQMKFAAMLLKNPFLPEHLVYRLEKGAGLEEDPDTKKEIEENLYGRIQRMNIAQKIKLAMKGNKSARNLLVRNPNKQISTAAMRNPKMTEDEVEFIVKNKGTSEHIFREVALNKEWMKSYNIISWMVKNPKTPLDISIGILHRLMVQDVEFLARSKDIPATLRQMAVRIIEQKGKK
jgi:hypothetical protein